MQKFPGQNVLFLCPGNFFVYKEEFYDTLSAIGILCPFSDELREVMAAWIIFSIHGASFRLEITP